MARKYWYSLFFLFSFLIKLNSQYPISNFGYHNSFYFNPAMAGIDGKRKITLNYHTNVEEKYGLISYEHPSKNLDHKIGLFCKVSLDKKWVSNNIGLAYNYTFQLTELSTITSGFQFTQFYLSRESSAASLVERDWQFYPSLDFGIVLTIDRIKLGASLFNLLQKAEEFDNSFNQNETPAFLQTKSLNMSLSYDFKIRKDLDFGSSFLFNKRIKNEETVDFSGHFIFLKSLMLGGTWRLQNGNFPKLFFGFQRSDFLTFQISFNTVKQGKEIPRGGELILQCNL